MQQFTTKPLEKPVSEQTQMQTMHVWNLKVSFVNVLWASNCLSHLKDAHNTFWWVTLKQTETLFTGKPLRALLTDSDRATEQANNMQKDQTTVMSLDPEDAKSKPQTKNVPLETTKWTELKDSASSINK